MTDVQLLDREAAAVSLRSAAEDARGFLGLDPVTQNDALLGKEIAGLGAQIFRAGNAILGFLPNHHQPRQAVVASTSADAEPLRAFLAFLRSYRRCTSYLTYIPTGSSAIEAFTTCGFSQVGTLKCHYFWRGSYVDVGVYFVNGDSPCLS